MVARRAKSSAAPSESRRGSEGTRLQLLEAAVELMAIHGPEGVSLRAIGSAAGQANTGVVHYYFGSREGLLLALAEHIATKIPSVSLAATYLPDGEATADDIAAALVLPLSRLLPEGASYLQFMARMLSDPADTALMRAHAQAQWFRDVMQGARILLGDQGTMRFRFAVTLAVHALADHEGRIRLHQEDVDTDVFVTNLISAVAALLRPQV